MKTSDLMEEVYSASCPGFVQTAKKNVTFDNLTLYPVLDKSHAVEAKVVATRKGLQCICPFAKWHREGGKEPHQDCGVVGNFMYGDEIASHPIVKQLIDKGVVPGPEDTSGASLSYATCVLLKSVREMVQFINLK